MRTIRTLCDDDAWAAIAAIRQECLKSGKAVVVAVADVHGETLGLLRVGAVALSSVAIAANKGYTAARLRRRSADVGRRVRDPQAGIDIAYYADPRYTGFGGGLPVVVDGEVVGAVAVSGLADAEDEALCEIGIAAILAAKTSA